MFELPEAKRVRREDLYGSPDGSESDSSEGADAGREDLEARLNAQIAKSLGLDGGSIQLDQSSGRSRSLAKTRDTGDEESDPQLKADEDGEEEDEGFDFRLFNTAGPVTKVILEDETEPQGEGGLVKPVRPLSYYMATDIPARQKQQYLNAAVSGEDVFLRSKQPSWGLQLPWKVTKISVVRRSKPSDQQAGEDHTNDDDAAKAQQRRRPGKKRRIALRNKARARKDKVEAAEKQKQEKEEHLKDKKKRLNRLKKLRRRAKDKEKKAASGGGEDEAGQSDGSSE